MSRARGVLRPVPAQAPRAVAYIRVSKERQDMISPELQDTAIRDHCARHGYTLVETLTDLDRTGRFWRRRQVETAVAMIEQGAADVLVVWKISRVARNRLDWNIAVDRVESVGGRLESATEPVDASTSTGRFTRGMLAELAAFESEVKGEQWKETHARRRASGLHHTGGRRHGYLYLPGKTWEPDPDTAPLVVGLYEQYVAGKGLATLAGWLRAVGLPPRVEGTHWTQRGVSTVLQSGFAAGLLHVHDPDCGCRKAATCSRKVWLPGSHTPIVGQVLWRAYLAEHARRTVTPARLLAPSSPLAGLVRCGSCGRAMASMGRTRPGYQCGNELCAHRASVRRPRAEQLVLEWLRGYADDVGQAAALAASEQASRTAARSTVTRLARAVTRLDAELVKLTREYTRGVIPEAAYVSARDELTAERATAQGELDTAAARLGPPRPSRRQAADAVAEWDLLPPAALNRVLRPLVRVVVAPGEWRSRVQVIPAWEWTPPAGAG